MEYEGDIRLVRRARKLLSAAVCSLSLSATMSAQAKLSSLPFDKSVPSDKALAFDVVSIRPSGKGGMGGFKILPDGYQAKGMSLANTILLAYFPAPSFKHSDELKRKPEWVDSELYDIEAKVSPSDLAEWQSLNQNMMQTAPMLQRMLRAMLADRFQLKIHNVPTQVDGYVLRLSKHALKLEQERTDGPSTAPGMQLLDGGKAVSSLKDGLPVWEFYGTSMRALVGFLSFSVNGPIVDGTGLQGKYHFILSTLDSGPSASEPADGMASDPESVVPLDIAELGLKLVKTKVAADSWVIDSIQRPSPN
jgi:uncharacterized protein (TIGR03435 family)